MKDNHKEEYCKKCKYRGRLSSTSKYLTCDYFLITGERRGCKASECDKFVEATPAERRKAMVVRLY